MALTFTAISLWPRLLKQALLVSRYSCGGPITLSTIRTTAHFDF
jgi:hypothetical protein